MADKFPEISTDQSTGSPLSDDLLAREKELLGEDAQEFQSQNDKDVLNDVEDGDVEQFKQQFPDVEETTAQVGELNLESSSDAFSQDVEVNAFEDQSTTKSQGPSAAVQEWKERFELEIKQRDEVDAEATSKTREEAEKQLDDFYEQYNLKKEENIKKAQEQEEKFIEKRDSFFTEGSVWRRAFSLIDGVKENKRFKEVLQAKVKSIQD